MKKTKIFIFILVISLVPALAICSFAEAKGDAYKIQAEELESFKKGDKVTLAFTISDINVQSGILGFDLEIKFDPAIVKMPIDDESVQDANKNNNSLSEISKNGGKWTISCRTDTDEPDTAKITILDDNAEKAVTSGTEIKFFMNFTALKDSKDIGEIGNVIEASGTSGKLDVITGAGGAVKVKKISQNPTTFDPGFIGISAMMLSLLSVLTKKKK